MVDVEAEEISVSDAGVLLKLPEGSASVVKLLELSELLLGLGPGRIVSGSFKIM